MTNKDKIEELHNFIDNVGDKLSIINYLVYQTYLDDIEEDLNILEEIRKTFKVEKEETINQNHYWLIVDKKYYLITRKQYEKWLRWLDNEK